MKRFLGFLGKALLAGVLVVAPIYLAVLLLLKAMKSVVGLVKPFTRLVPDWLPAENLLSLLLVLLICFLIGALVQTGTGRAARDRVERGFFAKIPGYDLIRSLTRQLAGESREKVWRPALAEIEDALVPAFIIEELADSRYTIFVPSCPTPFAGAVYILDRDRVHPLNASFAETFKVISKWGSGAKDLVATMSSSVAPPAPQKV